MNTLPTTLPKKLMLKTTFAHMMAVFAIFALALSFVPRAGAQEAEQTQLLRVYYPAGIIISGKGDDAVTLKSSVHIQAFPLSPEVIKKHGEDPLVSEDVPVGDSKDLQLPLGRYELHYSTRIGAETKTTIETVVLRADHSSIAMIDFSAAKTYIIGASVNLQQLEDAVYGLAIEVKELKAEVAAQKGAPAK